MIVLVLDTSTAAVTAGLVSVLPETVEPLAQRRVVDARAHGERLGPAIGEVLGETGARPADLAAIVAGLGPGPFTGLRVGLVTAAAMGQALGIPTYGVCSLDALGAGSTGTVLVATDARRREVYWAVYRDGGRVAGPAVDRPGDLAGILAGHGLRPAYAIGDGAHRHAGEVGLAVAQQPRYPPPLALAGLAADLVRQHAPGQALTPLYLRRPDAVEPRGRKPVGRKPVGRAAVPVRVERMRWWHIEELLPIEGDLFGSEHWTAAMFWNELANGHYYVVALDGGELVGYAGLAVSAPDEGWVNNIAVRRDRQRQGIGRALLDELIAQARRRGVRHLLLEVAAGNGPAQRLYSGYGFEVVGVRRGYYQPSNADALVMRRTE